MNKSIVYALIKHDIDTALIEASISSFEKGELTVKDSKRIAKELNNNILGIVEKFAYESDQKELLKTKITLLKEDLIAYGFTVALTEDQASVIIQRDGIELAKEINKDQETVFNALYGVLYEYEERVSA